jgi:hypothetical protein
LYCHGEGGFSVLKGKMFSVDEQMEKTRISTVHNFTYIHIHPVPPGVKTAQTQNPVQGEANCISLPPLSKKKKKKKRPFTHL